jgi:hypothetical protein
VELLVVMTRLSVKMAVSLVVMKTALHEPVA